MRQPTNALKTLQPATATSVVGHSLVSLRPIAAKVPKTAHTRFEAKSSDDFDGAELSFDVPHIGELNSSGHRMFECIDERTCGKNGPRPGCATCRPIASRGRRQFP